MNKKRVKRQNVTELILLVVLLVLINVVGSFLFFRLDLTQEKRYSLSKGSREFLRELDDIIYVKVYLDGNELPAGFRRLKKATREMLDEFRVYAKNNVEYEFINPSESSDKTTREEVYRQLAADGLEYFNITEQNNEGMEVTQVIFPGAMISYRAHGQEFEKPVNLLKRSVSQQMNDQVINRSMENLEYELISAFRHISREGVPKVAIIEGHGELDQYQMASLTAELAKYYPVQRVEIKGQIGALADYSALITADPKETFSEPDKFIIDQFIMNGGKVLWMVDAVKVDMNLLGFENETMGITNEVTRIGDMLFTYGARVNTNLIQDYNCAVLQVDARSEGEQEANWQLAPFVYFPLVAGRDDNPITRNLNPIRFEFVSSIDTVGEDPAVKKSILLTSSGNARLVRQPFRVSTEIFAERPVPARFPLSDLPVAVLLEGSFSSHFRNRLPEALVENEVFKVYDRSRVPTRMIVISDGEIARNITRFREGKTLWAPLGADQFNPNIRYGNKDFLLNCMNYLLDDQGVMSLRNREVKLRMMDFAKITEQRTKWQLINLIVPVVVVLLGGGVFLNLRKRKYTRKK